ncbi:MAG TPA: hypothetical protein VFV55_08535 [Usitatibacteraceae bacterium]|nr:hypothetical protein [Usitatibacteraceae bacterium]
MHPRDRAWRPSAAAFLLAAAILPATAADKPCSSADKAIDGVTTWAALQKAVQDFGPCDKGPTGDLFTEAILRVIISGWPQVGDAEPILEKDKAFSDWLNRRLSSPSLSTQDTAEIRDLAKASCPKGREKVCAQLLSAVEMGRALSAPELLQLTPMPATPAPAKGKP